MNTYGLHPQLNGNSGVKSLHLDEGIITNDMWMGDLYNTGGRLDGEFGW